MWLPQRTILTLAVGAGLSIASRLPAADCNRNGVEDFTDITTGISKDCNANEIPDECDIVPVNYSLALRERIGGLANATSVVARDLDGDGAVDLAVAQERGDNVLVFWNARDGTFGHRSRSGVGDRPQYLAAHDLDADGRLDLITANSFSLSILLNIGAARFGLARHLPVEFDPTSLAVTDLDGDGDPDLAVAGSFQLAVFVNDGNLSFTESVRFPIGSDPASVIGADLDGDGDVDLATGNLLNEVSILLNRGAGAFDRPRNYFAGNRGHWLTAADLDGDGDVDLAATNGDGEVTVLLNPGDATFRDRRSFPVLRFPFRLQAADLDLDGDLDLVVGHRSDTVAVLLNHGNAMFAPVIDSRLGSNSFSIATGDLDGDGDLEIATVNRNNATLWLLEREITVNSPDCNADGVPDDCQLAANDCNRNDTPDDCDIAEGISADCNRNAVPDECDRDCNENGVPDDCDLAAGSSEDCNGNGAVDECDVVAEFRFEPAAGVDRVLFHSFLTFQDLDGDGDPDLLALVDNQTIRTLLNSGDGTFSPPVDVDLGALFLLVSIGDLEGDGDADVILRNRPGDTITMLLNDGRGNFSARSEVSLPRPMPSATCGDVDGDGDLDLIAVAGDGNGAVFVQGRDGRFREFSSFAGGERVLSLLAADLNDDRDLDLVITRFSRKTLTVLLNNGSGTWIPSTDLELREIVGRVSAGDLDGDGDLDLCLLTRDANRVLELLVLRNLSDGTFVSLQTLPVESVADAGNSIFYIHPMTLADLDKDDDLDLALAMTMERSSGPTTFVSLLVNDGSGSFTVMEGPTIGSEREPRAVASADADGDGDDDLAMVTVPVCHTCIVIPETTIWLVKNTTIPAFSQDLDRNGTPDDCERNPFHRGDPTGDGRTDISDAIAVLEFLFRRGPAPSCLDAADADNDAGIQITDAVFLLRFLFLAGPPPPQPGPPGNPCGPDPDAPGSPGDLGCTSYAGC